MDRTGIFGAAEADGIVRCDACPVLCRIRPGRAGACHRYANEDGRLVRNDPLVLLSRPDEFPRLVASGRHALDELCREDV